MGSQPDQNLDEYSASATIIPFDQPIPLLRGPVAAGPRDDPSSGPFVLAFRDPKSWFSAFKHCESRVINQCEGGARIGCAISASDKCKPPWWRQLFGGKEMDLKERERCEELEMEGCLAVAKGKCVDFAKEKCVKPFRDARIAASERKLSRKDAAKLVWLASSPDESLWIDLIGFEQLGSKVLFECDFAVTNYKATDMLGSDSVVEQILSGANGSYTIKV